MGIYSLRNIIPHIGYKEFYTLSTELSTSANIIGSKGLRFEIVKCSDNSKAQIVDKIISEVYITTYISIEIFKIRQSLFIFVKILQILLVWIVDRTVYLSR